MRRRPQLEVLEDRSLPSVSVLSGVAFVDTNGNGAFDPGEPTIPGINVTLTGTTSQGTALSATTTSGANGSFSFLNVPQGTYQLSTGSGSGLLGGGAAFGSLNQPEGVDVVSGLSVAGGPNVTQNLGFRGLAPEFISLRMFMSPSSGTTFPSRSPGSGTSFADNPPFVKTPITDVSVMKNAADSVIDLAANFDDPDITNTLVRFDTSGGPMNVVLFDRQAPQTVANFLNYVQSGAYNNSIFHRLATNPFVLQGGGFTFNPNGGPSLDPIVQNPAVANEFGVSNTPGTLALAQTSAGPNSGTNQFYFNVGDNSAGLDPQQFTVFGKVAGPSDQNLLNTLAATPVNTSQAVPFNQIPLNNYSGTNFPKDTKASNFLLLKDVAIVSRGDFLTYSVVSSSNPTLVTATTEPQINQLLDLKFAPNQSGTAIITVKATDRFGVSVQTTFNVTVT